MLDAVPGLKRTRDAPQPRRVLSAAAVAAVRCGWRPIPNTRINKRRFEEATQRAGAEVIVTACPYCLIMFDDAIRTGGATERVAVKDIAEVLTERLGS